MTHRPPIGVLPAAGRAVRLGAAGYAKETFPILATTADGQVRLRPICELSMAQLRAAGAEQVVVVVSPEKTEVLRVLGGGHDGLELAYVVQAEPAGLPDALCRALGWIGDRDVLLALPDTVVSPPDALARVHAERQRTGADLVLGVFPVADASRLGPVELEPDGRVLRVYDKPSQPTVHNTWSLASFGARFSELLVAWEAERRAVAGPERVLGHVFDAALATLEVRACFFPEGRVLDIGTPEGLRSALRELGARGESDPAQAEPVRVR